MDIKKENFKRISENRIKKINDLISKLHNFNNPSFYDFEDKEIYDMFKQIQDELDKQKRIFMEERNKKGKRIKL